ncbi:hypothetical protein CH379_011260 [Leptospira ellisii]|uniref:Porin n=1 Tax=Leptospira ellisii TaxID=2023197 RepID=A0A2N0BAD6_9LEPT|nr:hypothetical protein [Leptospira ellisii]MDV6236201.1 hypothetical protein [Leptospira ellisii]PJZ93489.1 hypothetical protein CH379_07550 [Leptospira ellisii]
MKKISLLLTFVFLSAYALTAQEKQSPDLPSGIPEDNPKELPKSQEKKPEFGFSQSVANDVFVLGNSLFGERLSRRNNESYGTFSPGLVLGTFLNFYTPIPGFRLNLIMANPLIGRSNTDNDFFYQSTPGGPDQSDKVVKALESGNLTFDPNQVRPRKENNGLRDYFIGQIVYEWNTSIGQFFTGFLIVNSANYPSNSSLFNYTLGWKPSILAYLKPEIVSNYRLSSETNGVNQGNSHHRAAVGHEYGLVGELKFNPSLQVGYQYFNNNTDRRSGVTDVTAKLQLNFKDVNVSVSDVYRPDLYLFDNDRVYPKPSGVAADNDAEDGKETDPSKIHGTYNQAVASAIQSLPLDAASKSHLLNSYQQQHLPKHHLVVNLGYMTKF